MTTAQSWQEYKTLIEEVLSKYIPTDELTPSMEYTLLSAGKRFRASLCYLVTELYNTPLEYAHSSSVALECIHAYSLIHDDLPAMDDDDLRRGKPTCHKQFDEATAILTGDILQTLAFRVLSEDELLSDAIRLRLISLLAQASYDMVRGQQLDTQQIEHTLESLTQLHQLKTGALLTASILMGAVVVEADTRDYEILGHIGRDIGLAYQVQDDVIELGGSAITGKSKSDEKNDKITFVTLMGEQGAKAHYEHLYHTALEQINLLSVDGNNLCNLVKIMQNRNF